MSKFYIEEKRYGKYYHYRVKPVSGKALKKLEDAGEEIFDSYKEALDRAVNLKKRN